MQNHKCNEMENAFPIFKVSRLVRVHTDSHHDGHNKIAMDFRILPFLRASVCIFTTSRDVDVVHDLSHAAF